MLGRQGKEEVESAGRCTGGPPAVEQTPRPPALGPRPARAALALPVPPCILNTRVHRLPLSASAPAVKGRSALRLLLCDGGGAAPSRSKLDRTRPAQIESLAL